MFDVGRGAGAQVTKLYNDPFPPQTELNRLKITLTDYNCNHKGGLAPRGPVNRKKNSAIDEKGDGAAMKRLQESCL